MNNFLFSRSLLASVVLLALFNACGGGGANLAKDSTAVGQAPQVTAPTWSPADATLAEFKAYTFTTQAAVSDPADTIKAYVWDFGDGTPALAQAGASMVHAFTGPGPFTVKVTATDALLLTSAPAQAAVTVVAAADPFTLAVVSPSQASTFNTHPGNAVTLSYVVRAQTQGSDGLYLGNLVLDPGDPTAVLGAGSSGGGVFTLPVTYLAPASGSRVLNPTVQVVDNAGNRSQVVAIPPTTLAIVATDTPPAVTLTASSAIVLGPDTSFPGVAVTFNATASDAEDDPLTYAWTFGDGGLGDVAATTAPGALTQGHSYAAASTYTVAFTADDGRAGGKAPATLTMDILPAGAPLLAVIYAPAAPVYCAVPVTFTANGTDPEGTALSYAWTVNGQEQSSGPTFTWTFTSAGAQTVQLQVTDSLGQSTTWSANLNVLPNLPPVATLTDDPTVPLRQFVPHTFTALATDPDPGDTVASYQWLVNGDPVVTTGPTCTQTFTYPSDGLQVQVRAVDNHGAVGAYCAPVTFQVLQENQPGINANGFASSAWVALGGAWTARGTFTVNESVVAGNPPYLPLQSILFDPGDPLGSGTVAANPDGSYTVTATYQAAPATGARTLNPSLQVVDAQGVPSPVTSLGTPLLTTAAALGPLSVTYGVPSSSLVTSDLLTTQSVQMVILNPSGNFTTVTVDWGDGTPASTGGGTPDATSWLDDQYFSHRYAQPGTFQVAATVSDGRATATAPPLAFMIQPDAYPTATITSPTASAFLPPAGTFAVGGPVLPPGPQDPEVLVVPPGATVQFTGRITPPTVGRYTASWSAPGATPLSAPGATVARPLAMDPQTQTFVFPGAPGQLTPYRVEFAVVDQLGRSSSDPASGNPPRSFRKWVVVDGVHGQSLNVSCWYRQVSDRTGQATLVPADPFQAGGGPLATLYQDGVAQALPVLSADGTQAAAALPMRGDLPALLSFGPILNSDTHTFVMTIPNAPTGPGDPRLVQPADARSSFTFQSASFPYGPTLKLVLAQGFGPETFAPGRKDIAGALSSLAQAYPNTNGLLDRLSADPAQEANGSVVVSLTPLPATESFNGNQGFAEWPMFTVPQGGSGEPGFNLNYATYAANKTPSQSQSLVGWQAFRVPGSTTDPYDAGSTTNGWNAPSCLAALTPGPLAPAVPSYWQQAFYGGPAAGGLQNFTVPYAPDDPDRALLAPAPRPFSGAPATMAYAEYLWSPVWARPLVLNSADLGAGDAAPGSLAAFPGFSTAAAAAWPQLASPIAPDQSTFNLTPAEGAAFNAGPPVGTGGNAAPAGGVGRFFWTAFTPGYDVEGGALIARTWLADPATHQPPVTFAPAGPGDATTLLGLLPPQDVRLDIRARDPLTGQVTGSTGGYRILWYNPTVDGAGNVVAPDFWVVAVGSTHILVPSGYPAAPSLGGPVLTDPPVYLPSGNTPAQGPATDPVTHAITDTVAPGYCWFDLPAPFQPDPGQGQTLNLTVFGVKTILRNAHPAMARPLAFPDWMDALRLNTAQDTVVVDSLGNVTESDAYGIPFQFPWDIVLTNGSVASVAP